VGNAIASTGSAVQAGFQGGWTDPITHQVHMGARFYDPAAGQFLNQDPVTTPAQGDPAAGGDLHAYVDDSPVTGTDPTGHMLTAAIGGGCASAACAAAISRALAPKPAPKPAPKSCSWFSVCGLHKAVAKGKAVLAKAKKVATKTIAAVKKLPVVGRVVKVLTPVISDAYHVTVTFATRTVLPITRAAAGLGAFAIHVIATSVHQISAALAQLKQAASATVKAVTSFIKKHTAASGSSSSGYDAYTCARFGTGCSGFNPHPYVKPVPGGSVSFFAGIGASIAGTADFLNTVACPECAIVEHLTGANTATSSYMGLMKQLGVNTSPDSTFTGGYWSGTVLQAGLGGLFSAADAAGAAGITVNLSTADVLWTRLQLSVNMLLVRMRGWLRMGLG
jgi:RHS repeat-associated protein